MRELARTGLVAGAARLARLHQQSPAPRATGTPRVLLVRPDHLGDVLLSTPAIAALRQLLPSAYLVALVGPWSAGVLANNPDLDAVWAMDFPGFGRGPKPALWQPYARLVQGARRLRVAGFTAAINLRPDFWWGAALLALAGIPTRVGFDVAPGNRALTRPVQLPSRPEHAVKLSLRLVTRLADDLGARAARPVPWDPATAPLVFRLAPGDRAWADTWLGDHGLSPDDAPILLHPGAGAPVKLWTAAQWAHVLDRLAAETAAPIVVAGSGAEAAMVAAVVRELRGAAPALAFAQDVPLGRYAALLARSRLVLGVDSGPLHLAAALGVPSVRLHGPSDAQVFGPWGAAARHAVVASDLPCAPCGRLDYSPSELAVHPCVRLLTPPAVMAAARQVLGEARPPRLRRVEDAQPAAENESAARRER